MAQLETQPEFKAQAQDRRVAWYLAFAERHGNKDWKDWHDYSPLAQEWENLQDVIEWCVATDRYSEVCQFWQKVQCYSHTQGYQTNRLTAWATHLEWTDWLIQAAKQRQDWAMAAKVLLDRAWTLTLIGQPHHLEAAGSLFSNAWKYCQYADRSLQIQIAIHIAVWQIEKQQFSEASLWLEDASVLLQSADCLQATEQQRFQTQWHYYQGEIAYKTTDYSAAQSHFQMALQQAQASDWRRVVCLTQNWLADVAFQQGDRAAARLLLEEGLRVAEEYGDPCREAFCWRSLARLEQAAGNLTLAHERAEAAKRLFTQLGMRVELSETIDLLQEIAG